MEHPTNFLSTICKRPHGYLGRYLGSYDFVNDIDLISEAAANSPNPVCVPMKPHQVKLHNVSLRLRVANKGSLMQYWGLM